MMGYLIPYAYLLPSILAAVIPPNTDTVSFITKKPTIAASPATPSPSARPTATPMQIVLQVYQKDMLPDYSVTFAKV